MTGSRHTDALYRAKEAGTVGFILSLVGPAVPSISGGLGGKRRQRGHPERRLPLSTVPERRRAVPPDRRTTVVIGDG